MCLSLYMQLLQPLGSFLRVIISPSFQFARAVTLVKINKLIAADVGAMPIFVAFLTSWFQEPAVIFYMFIMLTVSAVLAGLLTARLIADAGLWCGLARGALSN
jgi:hypothetical protein